MYVDLTGRHSYGKQKPLCILGLLLRKVPQTDLVFHKILNA